jgi:hypothetical protein
MPSHFYVPVYTRPLVLNRMPSTLASESHLHLTFSSFGSPTSILIILHLQLPLTHKVKAFTSLLLFHYISTHLYYLHSPWSTLLRRPKPCPPVACAPSPSCVRPDLPSFSVLSASTRVPSTRILSWLLALYHRSEAHYRRRSTRLLAPSRSTTLPYLLLLRRRLRLPH